VALRRGVFAAATSINAATEHERHRIDVTAALLSRGVDLAQPPGAGERLLVAGHRSAGWLWDLCAPLPRRLPTPGALVPRPRQETAPAPAEQSRLVELVSGDRCRRNYRWGVHVRPAAVPVEHLDRLFRLPTTSLARTAVDLFRELPWPDAIQVADRAPRLGASHEELARIAEFTRRWRGGIQAVRAVAFADGRAESPLESYTRAVLCELGFPPPELQVDLFDSQGFIARVDILFREQRTIVEPDGKVKYTDAFGSSGDVLWREKLREDRLRDADWEVVRVTSEQVRNSPELVGMRVSRAFARAACLHR
jgi:hypothetical protein